MAPAPREAKLAAVSAGPPMSTVLGEIADLVAVACQAISVAYVALGAAEAVGRTVWRWRDYANLALKTEIWRRFAAAILLSLEFALAADIARTAIAPSWTDIGQLAAIAAIRTFLNWFLERDVAEARTTDAA
jgi:uncharacterized membrane protein